MQRLNSRDRDAIVLRFFERKDLRTVGATLGINDDAAQKRVARALEKLRGVLSRRGATLTATTLASAMAAEAVTAAPDGIALSVTAASLAGVAGSGTTPMLLKSSITGRSMRSPTGTSL